MGSLSELWSLVAFAEEKPTGGQAPGKMELVKTSVEKAIEFARKRRFDISQVPDFEKNYLAAQAKAKKGWTQRKDMPVITDEDVKQLQHRLEMGNLDINKPFASETNPKKPFPQGLSGLKAVAFMKRGLRDGSLKDDIIDVRITKKTVSDLTPIQKQIYYDKSMGEVAKFGLKATLDFIKNKSFFITSKDNFIIDGHHRFLSAMILDPTMKVNVLEIDLPIKKLLPLSLAYGDAVGHQRNA